MSLMSGSSPIRNKREDAGEMNASRVHLDYLVYSLDEHRRDAEERGVEYQSEEQGRQSPSVVRN